MQVRERSCCEMEEVVASTRAERGTDSESVHGDATSSTAAVFRGEDEAEAARQSIERGWLCTSGTPGRKAPRGAAAGEPGQHSPDGTQRGTYRWRRRTPLRLTGTGHVPTEPAFLSVEVFLLVLCVMLQQSWVGVRGLAASAPNSMIHEWTTQADSTTLEEKKTTFWDSFLLVFIVSSRF